MLLSFAQKLFANLVKLDSPEEVEGLDGYHCVATHVGTVTMIIGTQQRVFKDAYYCPSSVHTIVPGIQFDNSEYYFMGKDRAMHIYKQTNLSDELLASFPHDLTINTYTQYDAGFLSDMGPLSNFFFLTGVIDLLGGDTGASQRKCDKLNTIQARACHPDNINDRL